MQSQRALNVVAETHSNIFPYLYFVPGPGLSGGSPGSLDKLRCVDVPPAAASSTPSSAPRLVASYGGPGPTGLVPGRRRGPLVVPAHGGIPLVQDDVPQVCPSSSRPSRPGPEALPDPAPPSAVLEVHALLLPLSSASRASSPAPPGAVGVAAAAAAAAAARDVVGAVIVL